MFGIDAYEGSLNCVRWPSYKTHRFEAERLDRSCPDSCRDDIFNVRLHEKREDDGAFGCSIYYAPEPESQRAQSFEKVQSHGDVAHDIVYVSPHIDKTSLTVPSFPAYDCRTNGDFRDLCNSSISEGI